MKKWNNVPNSWGKSNDPCGAKWDGISCDGNSRITSLDLIGMDIAGTLSDDIGSLTELIVLDLSSNKKLGGSLPAALGELAQPQSLLLIGCNFDGPVPSELGNLSQLQYLALNSNKLNGSIPPTLGKLSSVIWLDLADNQLTGPLPNSRDNGTGLDQLLNAHHFHFNKNMLQGPIPESLFNSSMNLKHILLDRNNFTGPVPASIGVISSLEILRLNNNGFTGPVPSLSYLTKLQVLMLSNNKLSGPIPNLTGMNSLENVDVSNNSFVPSDVPSWFSDLTKIMTLTLQSIGLSGQVPQKFFSFTNLQNLVLSDNQLNGTLDMGDNISKLLDVVDIQNNKITSLTVYNSLYVPLKLVGNPLCKGSLLSDTLTCTEQQTGAPTRPLSEVPCVNYPFTGTMVFRAPSFANVTHYLPELKQNLSSYLTSCAPNKLDLAPNWNEDEYLNVDIKACPINQKKFNYSQTWRCFSLTLMSYHPPDTFGPHSMHVDPYPFNDGAKAKWFASRAVFIGIVAGSVLLFMFLALVGFYAVRQKKRAQRLVSINNPFASWGSSLGEDIGEAPRLNAARFFTLEELKLCTNDFREINAIGAGGYRSLYRGKLPDGQLVAIKRSKEGSMQGGLEFKTKIELLSRVHHKNLVGLVGFCFEKGEKMLVYEFIPNGTLSEALYGMRGIKLDWGRRLKIALDSARGLAYLHDHASPPIIHRDVKSTNILLDEKLTAKVADFGLSLLVSDSEEGQLCKNVKGTLGYLDPEYYTTQQLIAKSDVYSFGVVLLELIVAQPPIHEKMYIVRKVKMALDMEDHTHCGLKDVMDPLLRKTGELLGFPRLLELALQCVEEVAGDRPSMNSIVREIEVIMQDNELTPGSMSMSSSFSIDSTTTMKIAPTLPYSNASTSTTSSMAFDKDSKTPKLPYSNTSTSSTAFDMSSRAFEYSGVFPSSHGSLKP